ncbi:MAG: hypothetical protein IPP67_05960 [Rhodospirillaceae bacterium]|nr:hypothetical protein [Rhodospirillaceae bacterium]
MKKQGSILPVVIKKQDKSFFLEQGNKAFLTPKGHKLLLPNERLARALSSEYQMQSSHAGFLLKLCYTAVDYIADNPKKMVENWQADIDHDCLFHWSELPVDLYLEQQEKWQPVIYWFNQTYHTDFVPFYTFHVQKQPDLSKKHFAELIAPFNHWQLAVFMNLAQELSSSLLAWAVIEKFISVPKAVDLSLLEEKNQIGKWGDDPFLQNRRDLVLQECLQAYNFLELL